MVIGALIVLAPNFSTVHVGDLLIFAGTFFAPFGNLFQQKARAIASSDAIMFLRSLLMTSAMFLLAFVMHTYASVADIRASLPFLIVNGVILLGVGKIFWIESIHRISVTTSTALQTMAPFITLFLAWLILHQAPTVWQLTSLVPLVLGVLLLTDQIRPRLA